MEIILCERGIEIRYSKSFNGIVMQVGSSFIRYEHVKTIEVIDSSDRHFDKNAQSAMAWHGDLKLKVRANDGISTTEFEVDIPKKLDHANYLREQIALRVRGSVIP